MKITRKLSTVALFATAALTLAACGSDDNSANPTTTTSAASPTDGTATATSEPGTSEPGTAGSFECVEGELRSSGSTAQGRVMEEWILNYNDECGAEINAYGGGGSGKGISDFIANQVDFAGSDSALKPEQAEEAKAGKCQGAEPLNLPMVTTPVALGFNVPGVDALVLDAATIAGIFNNDITNWNDPAIAALNPDATLPDLVIQSVHRADDSGTTENFTRYLKAAGGDAWPHEPAKAWAAPGGIAGQGTDGVAQEVVNKEGTIGYMEWGFAVDNDLGIAQIDNGSGPVELTAESAGAALTAAEIVGTGNDLALELDYATSEPGAYPITMVTYEIVCSANNGEKADVLKGFLGWVATTGQQGLVDLGAAPLPAEIQDKVIASVEALS